MCGIPQYRESWLRVWKLNVALGDQDSGNALCLLRRFVMTNSADATPQILISFRRLSITIRFDLMPVDTKECLLGQKVATRSRE